MYDLIIVGQGAAGWSCAMTARMRGLSVLVCATKDGSALRYIRRMDNYPGLPEVSGNDLLNALRTQALSLQAEETQGLVRLIAQNGDSFMLLKDNDVLEARTVVIAIGAAKPKPLPGETERIGAGVSYCATCDGMFYKGKKIAILAESSACIEDVSFLVSLSDDVHLFKLKPHDSSVYPDGVRVSESKPLSITKQGLQTAEGEKAFDGIFIFRNAVPSDQLMPELAQNAEGIITDKKMRTNIPGLFAAGDCTGLPYQAAKAAGEGNIAAISVAEFLSKKG